jgi:3-oxoacyl-(acyl-carrier-protein) synthase
VLIVARHHSGAVKSNIGHLEGASGVAGVIKTIMVLEKGIIPPNANFESLNPKIDAEFLNIKVRGKLLCTYSVVFLIHRAVSLERYSMAYKWLA